MKNEVLHTFLLEQLKSVAKHLRDLCEDSDLEHLHHLRVNIKKIRAVLSFITNVYEEKFELKFLKLLFNKAGEIRELQINVAVINFLPNIPEAVIIDWRKTEEENMKKFMKDIPKYIRLVKRFLIRSFLAFPMPNEIITESYIRNKRLKATKRFNSKKRVDMHRFRKLIKKLIYVYEVLPEKTQKVIGIDVKFINQIQKEVGAWHDTYAAIAFIKSKQFDEKFECISILMKKEVDQFEKLLLSYPDLSL